MRSREIRGRVFVFFEWQLGQNQRPLQENAKRYSFLHSGLVQRTLANPLDKLRTGLVQVSTFQVFLDPLIHDWPEEAILLRTMLAVASLKCS